MLKRVAVTGMGIVSPVGNDVASFRKSIFEGACGVGQITRFDTEGFKVKIAAEVKDFDLRALVPDGEDPRRLDLFSQYALAAAEEAMKDSKLKGNIDETRLGVYIGSGIGGIDVLTRETEKYLKRGSTRVSPLTVPMMIGNMAAGNVAIRFGARGSCLSIVTACATSTHSIGEAFRAIRHGYLTAAIAGGSEAAVNPLSIAGFTNCMALTEAEDPMYSSLPFNKNRKGFVLGEGAGVIVLEEYEHACRRGATIYAEILGYGTTCDAFHITAPQAEGEGAARAFRMAMEEASDDGKQALYINAHGTGTPLNDKVETLCIKRALGMERAYATPVSSTKGATGHMLGAAGGAECIASILALKEGLLPPTLHLDTKDEECDLDYVPNTARPFQAEMALSASLGFGGHNGVLAIGRVK